MGKNYVYVVMYFIGIVPLALFNYFMPSLYRKNVFFGVTIPSAAKGEPELKAIESKYRKMILLGLVVVSIIYFIGINIIPLEKTSVLLLSLLLLYISFMYLIYLNAWKQTKRVKSQKKWDVNSKNIAVANLNLSKARVRLNPKWFLTYIFIIAITYFISYKLYLAAPDQIPIRYDFAGNISAYTAKSMSFVYVGLLSQIAMSLLMFFVFMANSKARVDIDPANIAISSEQTIRYKYRWSLFFFVVGVFLNVITGFMQLAILGSFSPVITAVVPLIGTVFILVYAGVLALKTGQSGSKIKLGNEVESEIAPKKDDDYWVGGLIYYNPKDPSLFVEKRSGIGYTLNFANKISWLLAVALVAFLAYSLTR